jgi:hypothetical protein
VLRRCFAGCFVKGFLVLAEKFGSLERSFLVAMRTTLENTVSCATLFTQFVSGAWTCSNEDSSWFPVDADAPGEHHRHQCPDRTHEASVFC